MPKKIRLPNSRFITVIPMVQQCFCMQAAQPGATLNEQALAQEGSVSGLKRSVFWKYLDERFFGEREKDIPKESLWKTRVNLLSDEERAAMEPLVQTKMEESQKRVLVDWDAEEARKHLSSFLFK
jgi:hypothetical protein